MRLIDADRLCEDLLNRWSIADTKKEELIRQVMADVVTPIVISQPTIEPQKWIPCFEGLPKVGDTYIVTGKQKWSNQKEWEYFTDAAIYEPVGAYIDDCWTTWNDWIEGQETHIIAWMEMPEPWGGDSDDNH